MVSKSYNLSIFYSIVNICGSHYIYKQKLSKILKFSEYSLKLLNYLGVLLIGITYSHIYIPIYISNLSFSVKS